MIKRFEYVMNNAFDDKTIIIIEKKGNDYYFSNNQLKNIRVNNEKTLEFINELLINLNLYKRKTKIIMLDESTGFINIAKENGEVLYYSSNDYLFGMIEDLLSDFEENVT